MADIYLFFSLVFLGDGLFLQPSSGVELGFDFFSPMVVAVWWCLKTV